MRTKIDNWDLISCTLITTVCLCVFGHHLIYTLINKHLFRNIDIDIDKDNLENIDIDINIDKEILENIDIDIDIDKDILENIDIVIDIDKGVIKIPIKQWCKMGAKSQLLTLVSQRV